jgi:hypothetical protein
VSPTTVRRGSSANLNVSVTASTNQTALIDLEIYDANGNIVFQKFWDNQSLQGGRALALSTTWAVPQSAATGAYTAKVGVFGPGWTGLRAWNNGAATFNVN